MKKTKFIKPGFTLIEVLIATAIFAMVSVMAIASFTSIIRVKDRIDTQRELQTAVRDGFISIKNDIMSASEIYKIDESNGTVSTAVFGNTNAVEIKLNDKYKFYKFDEANKKIKVSNELGNIHSWSSATKWYDLLPPNIRATGFNFTGQFLPGTLTAASRLKKWPAVQIDIVAEKTNPSTNEALQFGMKGFVNLRNFVKGGYDL